jgi:hypothetical protein
MLVLGFAPSVSAYRGVCSHAVQNGTVGAGGVVVTTSVSAPGWLRRTTGHHQLAIKGCPDVAAPKYQPAPDCAAQGRTGCVTYPRSDLLPQWAAPSPPGGTTRSPPSCASGCTSGVPTSDTSINPVRGMTPTNLASHSFMVQDSMQPAMLEGTYGAIVAADWGDWDNDGVRCCGSKVPGRGTHPRRTRAQAGPISSSARRPSRKTSCSACLRHR